MTGGYDYQYYLGDNLGNTRNTFGTKTGTALSYQQDDYYPFGLEILRTSPVPNPKNEYLYNKKELQEELTQYDYGARFYDPVVARWTTVDPHAEKYQALSPYVYVANNPLKFVDEKGKDIVVPDKNQQKQILSLINSRASANYSFDSNGKLQFAGNKEDTKGTSSFYSERLNNGIAAKGTITIKIGETYTDENFQNQSMSGTGEGITVQSFHHRDEGGSTKDADVTITGQSNDDKTELDVNGKPLHADAADVLQHELLGHALPWAAKSDKDTGNAVKDENIAREQEGKPLRKDNEKHKEIKGGN